MKFLHLICSVDPSVGGPIKGTRRLDEALAELGRSGEFATVGAPGAIDGFPAQVHALVPSGGRFCCSAKFLPWLSVHAKQFDAVIVNGLWQYAVFATRRALAWSSAPYFVLNTHGMHDPWFKRRYPFKHLKKWLYWPWAEYRVLRNAAAVLFTCEAERLLARESFWLCRSREVVLSYGTSRPEQEKQRLADVFLSTVPALSRRPLLFPGRIHEKKGCDLLVGAFARRCTGATDLHLVMADPDQEDWAPSLRAMAQRLGIANRISWPGMFSGDLRAPSMRAILSAFHHTRRTLASPWWRRLAAVGRCSSAIRSTSGARSMPTTQALSRDTFDRTIALLDRWLASSARACFESRFRIEQVAERLVRLVQHGASDTLALRAEGTGAHV